MHINSLVIYTICTNIDIWLTVPQYDMLFLLLGIIKMDSMQWVILHTVGCRKIFVIFSARSSVGLIACGKLKILLGYQGQTGHHGEIFYVSCINTQITEVGVV